MEYSFKEGFIYNKEKNEEVRICNFFPIVTDVKCYEKEYSTAYEVTIIIQYPDGAKSKSIRLDLNEISAFNWQKFDIKSTIFVSEKKVGSIVYQIIREQIQNMDVHAVPYFDKLGWTTYKNQPAYVAGYIVNTPNGILDPSEYHVSPELQNLKFDFNPNVSKNDSIYYFYDLLKINDNSLVLGMALITSLLYTFFEEAGHTPCFTTYCVGKSQTKKTTLARLICSLYNRGESSDTGIMDLLSSSTSLKNEAQTFKDCCFILDDLHPSECKSEMRRREERLSERIRVMGNHSERVTQQSNSLVAKCLHIVTGEYTLQSYSTNARCIILHFDKPVDNEELSYFQQDPRLLCTFVLHFLQWAALKKTKIIDSIKQNIVYNNFIRKDLSPRLAETECFLATSLDIFLSYAKYLRLDVNIKEFHYAATVEINKILARQEAEMERLRTINDPDAMFQVITKVFSGDKLFPSKPNDIVKSGYGIYKGNAYLDPDDALKLVQDALENWDLTKISLNKALLSLGVLSTDRSGKMTKKLCGKRMLVIPTAQLWNAEPLDGMISSGRYEPLSKTRKLTHSDFPEGELPLTRTSRKPRMPRTYRASRTSSSSMQNELDKIIHKLS